MRWSHSLHNRNHILRANSKFHLIDMSSWVVDYNYQDGKTLTPLWPAWQFLKLSFNAFSQIRVAAPLAGPRLLLLLDCSKSIILDLSWAPYLEVFAPFKNLNSVPRVEKNDLWDLFLYWFRILLNVHPCPRAFDSLKTTCTFLIQITHARAFSLIYKQNQSLCFLDN